MDKEKILPENCAVDCVGDVCEGCKSFIPLSEDRKTRILKWCGFEPDEFGWHWEHDWYPTNNPPDLDMNFYFKYAVPKLRYASIQFHGMTYVADVCADFAHHFVWSANDPAEALGLALEKLIALQG